MLEKLRTFALHASLETFLEATVLTLVSVVLVDRAVAIGAARVRQVSTDRSLEEALAALTRELAVVLAGTPVAADDALGARRRRKSARDVTSGLRRLAMTLAADVVIVTAADGGVATGNGDLLSDEVTGSEHRRGGRASVAVRSGRLNV